MGKAPSWKKIETEYITTGISAAKLAKKYGLSVATVSEKRTRGQWSKKRKEYEAKVISDAVDKIADTAAEKLKKEYEVACRMGEMLEKALKDDKQFFRHLDMYGREHKSNVMDMKRLSEAAKALKDLADIKKLTGGLISEFEDRKLKLEEKRLDMMKKETPEGEEGGVIILPEVEENDENDMDTAD